MSDATTYAYKGRDLEGNLHEGAVTGTTTAAAEAKLRRMGYTPLDVREQTVHGLRHQLTARFETVFPKRTKLKDVAVFARQFATMINSGMSMIRSLTILSEQTSSNTLREIIGTVKTDIEQGQSISEAMALHPRAFPPLMVNMVRAGEAGGFLDKAMIQIAENYEAEVKLKGKIKAKMTYPVVVFFLAIVMCGGMLIFIVPVFKDMFANLGGELPLPTQILVNMSAALRYALPVILVATVAGIAWWRKNGHTQAVRERLDPIKLKIPVFGNLIQKVALTRFARNFGALLASGVPILQCLDIVADTTGSTVIAKALREVQGSVRSGESISEPLTRHPIFPVMIVQMMTVGEFTGDLAGMLEKIGEFYAQEVQVTTEALTALIEPLMIAVIAAIAGSMLIALYLPIFKVFDLIN